MNINKRTKLKQPWNTGSMKKKEQKINDSCFYLIRNVIILIRWRNLTVHWLSKTKYLQPPYHTTTLQWRHNESDGVSNHQPHDCLLNRLLCNRLLRVIGTCSGTHRWQVKSSAQGQVTRKMLPFDDVIMQKHGYSSKHRESENKSYRPPILERHTMIPSKRCLLLVISLECHLHQE